MLAALVFQVASTDSSSDIGSLVSSLLSDLQSKAWLAAIPVSVLLVLAVLKKFGVIGAAPAAPAPAPVPAPVDASKSQDLLSGKDK